MHVEGERFLGISAEKTFPGKSLIPQAPRIKTMIARHGAETILDYGSGKGYQYGPVQLRAADGRQWASVQEFWGVRQIRCYDPCFVPHSTLPEGKFDGVISTDVLEHCPEEDIDWILDEIFSYAKKFVFANVACFPAGKRLPTGENAHITIYPRPWWEEKIRAAAKRHPDIAWEFWIQSIQQDAKGVTVVEERLGPDT